MEICSTNNQLNEHWVAPKGGHIFVHSDGKEKGIALPVVLNENFTH